MRVLIAARPARARLWSALAAALSGGGAPTHVVSPARTDVFPEHWHKSRSPEAAAAWRAALVATRPDVALVDGWRGLSDDLVRDAARAGVPSVLVLAEHDATCALGTRRRTSDGAPCDAPEGFQPCLACAADAPPRATWVPEEQRPLLFERRRAALAAERKTARVVVEHHGPTGAAAAGEPVPSPTSPPETWRALLARAAAAGAPEVPPEAWFEARMALAELQAWDAAARAAR